MPPRHTETRNIVFHKRWVRDGSLCMMKTEISNNGAVPVEARERHPAGVTQDHNRTGSARFDQASDRSVKEKKQSLFRRPCVTVVVAALAVVGFVYGGVVMFPSFPPQTTHYAVIDVHFVSVLPAVLG